MSKQHLIEEKARKEIKEILESNFLSDIIEENKIFKKSQEEYVKNNNNEIKNLKSSVQAISEKLDNIYKAKKENQEVHKRIADIETNIEVLLGKYNQMESQLNSFRIKVEKLRNKQTYYFLILVTFIAILLFKIFTN